MSWFERLKKQMRKLSNNTINIEQPIEFWKIQCLAPVSALLTDRNGSISLFSAPSLMSPIETFASRRNIFVWIWTRFCWRESQSDDFHSTNGMVWVTKFWSGRHLTSYGFSSFPLAAWVTITRNSVISLSNTLNTCDSTSRMEFYTVNDIPW